MRGLMNPDRHHDRHEPPHDPPTTPPTPCPLDRLGPVARRKGRRLPQTPDCPRRVVRPERPPPPGGGILARVHAGSRMLSESDVATPRRTLIVTASLAIRATGGIELPLVCSPSQVAPMLGRSEHSIRDDCIAGLIPTLPRASGSGAHHRIATARLLDQIGIPYEIVRSKNVAS